MGLMENSPAANGPLLPSAPQTLHYEILPTYWSVGP